MHAYMHTYIHTYTDTHTYVCRNRPVAVFHDSRFNSLQVEDEVYEISEEDFDRLLKDSAELGWQRL